MLGGLPRPAASGGRFPDPFSLLPRWRPTVLQSADNNGNGSATVTLPRNPRTGSVLIAMSGSFEVGNTPTVSGGGVTTWHLVGTSAYSTGNQARATMWWGVVDTTPSTTVSFGAYNNLGGGTVMELAGLIGEQLASATSSGTTLYVNLAEMKSAGRGGIVLMAIMCRGTPYYHPTFTAEVTGATWGTRYLLMHNNRYTPNDSVMLSIGGSDGIAVVGLILR